MPDEKVRVQPGDCVASLGFKQGHLVEAVWSHPGNEKLRSERQSPYVLEAGDVLALPEKRVRTVTVATGQRHVFRRLGVPEKLRLQLCREGKPVADAPYELVIEGASHQGKTDAEGRIEHRISPAGGRCTLTVLNEVYELALGHLSPVSTREGMRSRLVNLGRLEEAAEESALTAALALFQAEEDLDITGEVDEPTWRRMLEIYGT